MSQWKDILDGVSSTLTAGVVGIPTITILKSAIDLTLSATSGVPATIICPIAEESPIEHAFTALTRFDYPVGIFLIYTHDRSFTITATMPNMRESIRQALDKRPPLSTVSTVYDVDIRPAMLYTHRDNPNTVFDITMIAAIYSNWETRSSGT